MYIIEYIFLFKVVSVIKNCTLKSDVNLFITMIQILVQWHMIVVNISVKDLSKINIIVIFKFNFCTEKVFARPSNKCYINENVYEPVESLSKIDSALNPCFAACFCDQRTYNKYDNIYSILRISI